MKKTLIIFIAFIYLFTACHQTEELKDFNSRIICTKEFSPEQLATSSCDPIVNEDQLILFKFVILNLEEDLELLAYDRGNMDLMWSWKDTLGTDESGNMDFFSIRQMQQIEDVLVIIDDYVMVGINIENGQTLWRKEFPFLLNINGGVFNDKLYAYGDNFYSAFILEVDPQDGNWKEVIRFNAGIEYMDIEVNSLKLYSDQAGNKIVFSISYVPDNENDHLNFDHYLYQYNLDSGEQLFAKSFPNTGGTNVFHIEDGELWGLGHYVTHHDISSGNLLKQNELEYPGFESLTHIEFPYAFIMVNELPAFVTKIDMRNGDVLWKASLNLHQSLGMKYYKGTLYMVDIFGKLYLINSENGVIEEIVEGPFSNENETWTFADPIGLDEEGIMYLLDYRHIICYDIN